MPLQKIHTLGPEQAWGLWQIDESEESLSYTSQESCPEDIVNLQKRLEWLAARVLMKGMIENIGLAYAGLRKDEFGKPFLKEYPHQISLSHSYPYVAAQVARAYPVGIDLEQPTEKLKAIAHRVFNLVETRDAGDDVVKLCVYWCAKEALYKIYGKRSLLFTDHLQVLPFDLKESGHITGKIRFQERETSVPLAYWIMPEFVLVTTDAPAA